jgi:hypothetical protein
MPKLLKRQGKRLKGYLLNIKIFRKGLIPKVSLMLILQKLLLKNRELILKN